MKSTESATVEVPPSTETVGSSPVRWLTIFPWLEIAGRAGVADENHISEEGSIDEIVSLAVERMTGWLIGDLFPAVAGDESLLAPPFSVRLSNVLRREEKFSFSDLADVPLRDAMAMRSMGAKSITELLRYLAATSISRPFDLAEPRARVVASAPSGRRLASESRAPSHTFATAQVFEDLDLLSRWAAARGDVDASLTATPPDEAYAPSAVRDAYRRVRSLSSAEWSSGQDVVELGALLTELSAHFDPRERAILHRRLGAREPETLDALATEFGVTRERIRQLEAVLKPKLRAWIAPDTVVGMRAAALRARIAPFAYTPDVLADIPSLGGMLGDSDIPAWFLLERIDDELETDGDWMATPTMVSVREETLLRFEQVAGDHGAASDREVRRAIGGWAAMPADRLGDWLDHLGFVRIPGGWCEPGRRAIPQLAAGYLELRGEPQVTSDLHAAVAPDRSIRSLKNALMADALFQRSDRDSWGLASWGGASYTGIRRAIEDLLDEHDGMASLRMVTDSITSRFSVSPKSVAIYANAAPFRVRDGIVSLDRSGSAVGRPAGMTRNVYRAGGRIRYRITVNNDHLRGSASPMPVGLAEQLGIERGKSERFSSGGRVLVGNWIGEHPSFTSVRELLIGLDASKHDEVVLEWAGREIDAWIVPAASDDLRRAAGLMGFRADEAFTRAGAASALELPSSSSWSTVADRLRTRNESQLGDLISGFDG